MVNVFWKSDIGGNFGDDLNEWLWPHFFSFDGNEDAYFIGIGSILTPNFEERYNLQRNVKKIVFGSGLRPTSYPYKLNFDDTWDIRFLRGPLSSQYFDNKYPFITDAAYTIRQLPFFNRILNTSKKYKISLMPYFRSVPFLNWKLLCDKLGYHYISPISGQNIEYTLDEIAASEYLITEAMHGAIVADILRVPWARFVFSTEEKEGAQVSTFKWNDWLLSIGFDNIKTLWLPPLYRENRISNIINRITRESVSLKFTNRKSYMHSFSRRYFDDNIEYYLSSDLIINIIDAKISEKINNINIY